MSKKVKIFLTILFCLFYVPGYFFLYVELHKDNYEIPSVIIGSFFTLLGLFGHSTLLFEEKWTKFEGNEKYMKITKYFFKFTGTIILGILGLSYVNYGFNSKSDSYSTEDIKCFKGVLAQKPEFKRGAKSSTYLHIYLKEFPEYIFEPQYERYVHYNTNFEDECNIGDTVVLGVLKESYEKSITKMKQKTYFEKHINAKFITVYNIQKGETNYYNIELHNQFDKEENESNLLIGLILGTVFLSCSIVICLTELIYLLRRNGFDNIADRLEYLQKKK